MFEIVDSDHKVGISGLNAIFLIEVFDEGDVPHVDLFALLLVAQAIIKAGNHGHGAKHPPKVIEIKGSLAPEANLVGLGKITTGLLISLLDVIIGQLFILNLLHSLFQLLNFFLLVSLIVLLNIKALPQDYESAVEDGCCFDMLFRVN